MSAPLSATQSSLIDEYLTLRNFSIYGPIGGEIPQLRDKRIQELCIVAHKFIDFVNSEENGELQGPLFQSLPRFLEDVESIPTDPPYALSLDWAVARLDVVLFETLWERTGDTRFLFAARHASLKMIEAMDKYEAYRRKYPNWADGHLKRLK